MIIFDDLPFYVVVTTFSSSILWMTDVSTFCSIYIEKKCCLAIDPWGIFVTIHFSNYFQIISRHLLEKLK